MFNNLRKFLREGVSHNKQSLNSCFCLLSLAVVLATSAIKIARADVCFLPDSKGCEQVPYEEYGGVPNPTYPKDCFATKAEAMSARTSEMDSYYKNGDMWCIKSSCSEYLYNSEYKGGNWSCDQCPDANSTRANFYNCTCPLTAKSGYEINYNTCAYAISQCTGSATTSCVTSECQTCAGTGQYSGGNECKIPTPVTAHCPNGYVSNEPAGGCYSTQDMVCGSGKCYKETETPECGEGKRLVKANGVCSCECKTGYHTEGGNCVLNQCSSGVAENTCNTANGYTFEPNNSSFINTSGNTVKCGTCVKEEFKCEDFGMVNEIPEQNCANGTKDIYVELPIPNTGGKKAYELYGVHCYSKVANVPCPECVDTPGPTGCNNSGYRYEYTYSEVRNCYEKKQVACSCEDVNYPNDCNVSPYFYFNGKPYDEDGRCIYYENGQYLGINGRGVYRYCKPLEYGGKVCGATYVDIPCYECIGDVCYTGSTHTSEYISYPSYLRLQH